MDMCRIIGMSDSTAQQGLYIRRPVHMAVAYSRYRMQMRSIVYVLRIMACMDTTNHRPKKPSHAIPDLLNETNSDVDSIRSIAKQGQNYLRHAFPSDVVTCLPCEAQEIMNPTALANEGGNESEDDNILDFNDNGVEN